MRQECIFGWWRRQIRAALPWAARRARSTLLVEIRDFPPGALAPSGSIIARRDGIETLLASLTPAYRLAVPAPLHLRLPDAMLLRRRVRLPLQAERDLPTALGFEMDRLTPFAAPELYWNIADLQRGRNELHLTLLAVPRARLEPLLATLSAMRLHPSHVESASGLIPLQPARTLPGRRALLVLCLGVALVCTALPFVLQQQQDDAAQARLAALYPARLQLETLHRQIAALRQADAAASAAGPLQLLAALTAALPDGTWLTGMELTASRLTISGQSDDAARLISILSALPALRNPGFIGSVTRAGDGERQFSLQAEILH